MGLHLLSSAIDTDVTLAVSSDTKVPSVAAIKAFITASAGGSIVIDGVPTNGSANAVSSDGVFNALSNKQTLSTDLTAIAGLTLINDNIIQRKAGSWVARTPAQFKVDLALSKSDLGLGNVDNTSNVTERATAATLTNKTISGSSNTFSNIPESAVTNLISDLFLMAPKASPALTGIPSAPTAAVNTNTTQLATTAFVQAAVPTVEFALAQYSGTGGTGNPLTIANLSGSVITSGTVAAARIDSAIPRLATSNTFTGTNNFADIIMSGGILSNNDSPGYALYGTGTAKLRIGGAAEFNSTIELLTAGAGIYGKSPNGTRYVLTFTNAGAVVVNTAP